MPNDDPGATPMPIEGTAGLADLLALHELRARYTHYYDGGDLEKFVALFTDDGVLQLGPAGFARGHDQLRAALATPMQTASFACHFTSDEITEFTGADTARGTSRFAVHYGRSPDIQGAGTYHDEYRRTAHGWRFASRTISFFYMGPRDLAWPPTPPPISMTDAHDGRS
jgi:ketosteroid isomerase-like protein